MRSVGRGTGVVFGDAFLEIFGGSDLALSRETLGLEEVDVHRTTHDEGRCGAKAMSYCAPGISIANHGVIGIGATKDTKVRRCSGGLWWSYRTSAGKFSRLADA